MRPVLRRSAPAQLFVVALVGAAGGLLYGSMAEACTVWTTAEGAELHFAPGQTVKYYIQVDGSADIANVADVYGAIQAAMDTWSGVSCGEDVPQLQFEYVDVIDTDPANFDPRLFRDEKNMISFINEGWEGDPDVLARTRILWNGDTGEIMEFGIAFNDQYTDWSVTEGGEAGKYDIQSVLMRQIGLIMGLGSSEFEDSVMYPVLLENNTTKRTLSNDDVLAVCDLYAPGRADWTMAPAEMSCSRDFHPGAQPANNGGNNGGATNNATNNGGAGNNGAGNNGAGNNGTSNNGTNNGTTGGGGVGAACTSADDCTDGLLCGCPASLGTCETDICYQPSAPPAGGGGDDDSCTTARPGRSFGRSELLVGALSLIGLAWVALRRR